MKYLISFGFLLSYVFCNAQVVPPYTETFDDSIAQGWIYNGDFELGAPSGTTINSSYSNPYSLKTNLNGYAIYSSYAETESFDLSNISINYIISFRQWVNGGISMISYSTNNGATWQNLNNAASLKTGWMNTSYSWNIWYSYYLYSAHSLDFLAGQPSVKFQLAWANDGDFNPSGLSIDNFSVVEDKLNLTASAGDSILHLSKNNTAQTAHIPIQSFNPLNRTNNYKTRFYYSTDPVYDASDVLFDSVISPLPQHGGGYYSMNIDLPSNLSTGYKYIFYKLDDPNIFAETDEIDNLSMLVVQIDTTFEMPYIEDFEVNVTTNNWKGYNIPDSVWQFGVEHQHDCFDAHSGDNCWYVYDYYHSISSPYEMDVYSPFININDGTDTVVYSLWYKHPGLDSLGISIEPMVSEFGSTTSGSGYYFNPYYATVYDEWSFANFIIPDWALHSYSRVGVKYHYEYTISFDDVYVGAPAADLSIRKENAIRTYVTSNLTDTIFYELINSGIRNTGSTLTKFYWSTDSIYDVGDVLVATQSEAATLNNSRNKRNVLFTIPATLEGNYYLFYKLDDANQVAEMREYNNLGRLDVILTHSTPTPYFNDFESTNDGWYSKLIFGVNDWENAVSPSGLWDIYYPLTKGWVTSATTNASPESKSYLYSPAFDLSTIMDPILSFDLYNNDYNLTTFNSWQQMGSNLSYSIDGGANWKILDTTSNTWKNFYYFWTNAANEEFFSAYVEQDKLLDAKVGTKNFNNTAYSYLTRDNEDMVGYVMDLEFLSGAKKVQFRYAVENTNVALKGLFIDNFQIIQGFPDLSLKDEQDIYLDSNDSLKINMDIVNFGYRTNSPTNLKLFLSTDSILDGSDILWTNEYVGPIRPAMKSHIRIEHPVPLNISTYNYLIYSIDQPNIVNESNESNNTNYLNLHHTAISSFPYVKDFDHDNNDNWYEYATIYDVITPDVRINYNKPLNYYTVPNLVTYGAFSQSNIYQLFPVKFLFETPVFDFSVNDSVWLTLHHNPTGYGGTFQFSTNGGNNWQSLIDVNGTGTNWLGSYPNPDLPGVAVFSTYADTIHLAKCDISPLVGGNSQVKFRYLFCSPLNHFQLDLFQLDAEPATTVSHAGIDEPKTGFNYSVLNNQLYINITSPFEKWELMDINGKIIYTNKVEGNYVQYDLQLLSSGVYLIRLLGKQTTKSFKITKI